MNEENDNFLSVVSNVQHHTNDQGWIKLTLKRDMNGENGEIIKKKPFLKRKQQQELIKQYEQEALSNPEQNYACRFKIKDNFGNRGTTYVKNPNGFTQSLINVFRLHFFKDHHSLKKKIQKQSTQADPKSKKSLKKIQKRQQNREKRQKGYLLKRESKREKQRQQNLKNNIKNKQSEQEQDLQQQQQQQQQQQE